MPFVNVFVQFSVAIVKLVNCLCVQDGGLNLEPNYVEQFSELNLVLDGLRRKDIQPALE